MVKRGYKLIISVIFVVTLFIGFGSSFASAAVVTDYDLQSLIWACMFASNLVLEPVDTAFDYAIARAVDPLGLVPSIHTGSIPDYLEQSVIKVLPDVVTIDGVAYSDIWLGPEAAQALRLSGLDFATAYNILNNQSSAVTYAQGVGYGGGLPFYSVNGVTRTQEFSFSNPHSPVLIGSDYYFGVFTDGNKFDFRFAPASTLNYSNLSRYNNGPFSVYFRTTNNSTYRFSYYDEYGFYNDSANRGTFTPSSFQFDYTSGVIDAPLASDQGLLIRVPSSHSGSTAADSYDVHDVVYDYPGIQDGHYIEIDPDLNPDFQVDIDLSNKIGELIRTILLVLDLLDNIEIEFAPEPEPQPEPSPEPTPPPSPEPSTPLSDQDAEWLDQVLRWIQETIAQVKTASQTLEQSLAQILEQIQTLPQEILQDIETAPIDIYRQSLEIIKTVFAPVLMLLKSTIGLWHYVVEWVQATAPVFSSFFGLMNGISYNMVLPIYASLAGPIVIAVYKRFGK